MMPFGSRQNNFLVGFAIVFVVISIASSVIGQVLWNSRTIRVAIRQHDEILERQREMQMILRGLERRYLAGAPIDPAPKITPLQSGGHEE